jgi:type I restriction enzyme S subunit
LQLLYKNTVETYGKQCENGKLSDIAMYSKDKVSVSKLTLDNYFSTENMLPNKKGVIKATSLPASAYTTACHFGDTLISNIRPYFKKILYCQVECGCSADVLCLSPHYSQFSEYLFSTVYADKFFDHMLSGAKGTKMPRGDKVQIMNYPIIIPTEDVINSFNSYATPILRQVKNISDEIQNLQMLRDMLLPKLMSGELDVSNIDI